MGNCLNCGRKQIKTKIDQKEKSVTFGMYNSYCMSLTSRSHIFSVFYFIFKGRSEMKKYAFRFVSVRVCTNMNGHRLNFIGKCPIQPYTNSFAMRTTHLELSNKNKNVISIE